MVREEPRWHPILAAREGPVGTWRMIDRSRKEYSRVRLVRVDGELLGYVGTLRSAATACTARTSERTDRSVDPAYSILT